MSFIYLTAQACALMPRGNGHYAIADLNHDGNVDLSDGGDRYIAGQATPKIILGSNLSLRYRKF